MEVIGEGQFIIENIDGVDEYVDDLTLVFRIVDVSVFEVGNPVDNLGLGIARTSDLRLQDALFETLFLFLQLLQPFLGGFGEDAHLDGVEQILNGFFTFRQLMIQRRKRGIFPLL